MGGVKKWMLWLSLKKEARLRLSWHWALSTHLQALQIGKLPRTSWHFPDKCPDKSCRCQAVWDLLPLPILLNTKSLSPQVEMTGFNPRDTPRWTSIVDITQNFSPSQHTVLWRWKPWWGAINIAFDTDATGARAGEGSSGEIFGWCHLRYLSGINPGEAFPFSFPVSLHLFLRVYSGGLRVS